MKPLGFRNGVCLAALSFVLAGCAVGPDYHHPAAPNVTLTPQPLPSSTVKAGRLAQNFVPGADIPGDWWHLFQSPQLDALIAGAFENNPNLAAAQDTLLEAEQNVRAAQGSLLPTLSGSFGVQRDKGSGAGLAAFGNGSAGETSLPAYTLYNASLSVSYS
ncbi:MAG: TolC family protein, partial [Rhodospirillales bacterium]|nr:TolC family protein [Rhodospirillales bacterium]